ncbi:WD40-repeat-containing domain protein [Pilobolus umbonatus]|nr:WD40-repeat-containing domain protein [Pilobolus umbonatus]
MIENSAINIDSARNSRLEKIVNTLGYKERVDLLNYLQQMDKFDIISHLPSSLTSLIFQYMEPEELCFMRFVSRAWNKKIMDNLVWEDKCIEYGILQRTTRTVLWDYVPIYYDIFRRSLTMNTTWTTFNCKRSEVKYHKGPILSMLIVDPTRVISGDVDGRIHVWDTQKEHYIKSIQAHSKHVSCLAYHGIILASGSSDNTIAFYDLLKFQPVVIERITAHDGPVTSLAFSTKDENILFSGSTDRTICLWDIETGQCLRVLYGQENTIHYLFYCERLPTTFCKSAIELSMMKKNRAGYLLSGSSDRNIFLWDLGTSTRDDIPQVVSAIMDLHGPVSSLAIYDETKEVHEYRKRLSENQYTRARVPLNIPPFIICAGFSDPSISLFSLPELTRTNVHPPNVHRGTIWSIAAAPIHSKVITASGDRKVIIWDLKNPKEMTTLGGFDSAVLTCTVSPQEEILCFGTERGTIVIFDMQEFH